MALITKNDLRSDFDNRETVLQHKHRTGQDLGAAQTAFNEGVAKFEAGGSPLENPHDRATDNASYLAWGQGFYFHMPRRLIPTEALAEAQAAAAA